MIDHAIAWLTAAAQSQIFGGGAALAVFGYVGFILRRIPTTIYGWCRRRAVIEMSVRSDDQMFGVMTRWVASQQLVTGSRSLRLLSRPDGHDDMASAPQPATVSDVASEQDHGPRWILSPASGVHVGTWKGWPFMLSIDDGSGTPQATPGGGGQRLFIIETLRFTTVFRPPSFLREIVEVACARVVREPKVRVNLSAGHGFGGSLSKRPRPLSTVITAGDVGQDLLADMRQFYASADWYVSRGLPWRRGYLLKGPPGTGKSSLVFALASELRCEVYIMNLADAHTDIEVLEMLRRVPAGAIALFEDIDAAGLSGPRGTKPVEGEIIRQHVTLSAVLNALDGVAAGEGRVVIMTSNYPERLDPALVRPGRVDRVVGLENFSPAEAARMFDVFFPDAPKTQRSAFLTGLSYPIQPAALQGMLLAKSQGFTQLAEPEAEAA